MTHLARQPYQDIDLSSVDPLTHPITQLKYDGIWCDAHVVGTNICYYSRHGQLKRIDSTPPGFLQPGHYIGEFMFGSEWAQSPTHKDKLYLFDYLPPDFKSGWETPYQNRMQCLKELQLASNWEVVESFSTLEKDNIWTLLVDPGLYEGLVFRHPEDTWLKTVLRAKGTVTEDMKIIGVEEGEGRLRNCLGAIICQGEDGVIHTIGGGLTDKLRRDIWHDQFKYVGKWIRVSAKKKFASGQLRHPNFHSFHEDK